MGIVNDQGTHELYLSSVFDDGTRSGGYRGVGADAQVESSWAPDGTSLPESRRSWRPAEDVVAFEVTCDCSVPGTNRATSTVLARWERVPEQQLEDLSQGRLFVPAGEDAMDASDRPNVEAAMLQLWSEHVAPLDATAALQVAWVRHRQALADVDEAVRAARAAGLSWVDVGRATGMTRQSARERWGTNERTQGREQS
jgi:hypothetical protein